MLMRLLINIITKIKTNMIFMMAIYTIVIIGCSYLFITQPDVKVTFIYTQF